MKIRNLIVFLSLVVCSCEKSSINLTEDFKSNIRLNQRDFEILNILNMICWIGTKDLVLMV
jgi:hypothetical protein